MEPNKPKSIIIYFSQTGNTKKIAQAIQSGIIEANGSCDIARIQDAKKEDLAGYDLIGLGSPVWHSREPSNVLNFIEYVLRGLEEKQGFTFCTHGLYPANYIGRVVSFMKMEGLTVIGWNNWYAGVCLPEHPKPYFTDGHPDEIDLEEARSFGQQMAERSQRIARGETHLIPELPVGAEYHELYPGPGSTRRTTPFAALNKGEKKLELLDLRSFELKVNEAKCLYPKCTICIDNCPNQSINFTVTPRIFRRNCDRCWFCEQICPQGAIEVDWEPVGKFVQENIVENWFKLADEAAAKGRLRRLVDPKDIGVKTFWYTRKKPRLKVRI